MQGAFMDRDRGAKDAVDALEEITEARLVLSGCWNRMGGELH